MVILLLPLGSVIPGRPRRINFNDQTGVLLYRIQLVLVVVVLLLIPVVVVAAAAVVVVRDRRYRRRLDHPLKFLLVDQLLFPEVLDDISILVHITRSVIPIRNMITDMIHPQVEIVIDISLAHGLCVEQNIITEPYVQTRMINNRLRFF